jgi:branched-chain amino acid transport system substrate-binding protein
MKRTKWTMMVALLAVFALIGAACGGDDDPVDGDEVASGGDCTWVIGSMGALSGDAASIGQPINNGIQYGVDQVNANGDLACELELVSEDSQGNPEQAPALAQSLVEDEDLVAVVGPYFSGETLAVGDIFEDAGVTFACPSCTNETIDDQGWTRFFRLVGDDALQGEQAAIYIDGALQPTTVAIIHDNQDYSKGLAENVAKNLESEATEAFVINPEETDYSAVVSQVVDSGADVVYYGGYAPQAGPLARQLKNGGVDATFLSDDGTKDNSFGELAGGAAQGAQVTCPCADPAEVEGGEEFVSGMNEAFGEAPGTFAAEGFDGVQLVAAALADFDGDSDITEIRDGITEFFAGADGAPGVTKSYTFGDTGNVDVGPSGIFVYEWDNAAENFVVLGTVEELI